MKNKTSKASPPVYLHGVRYRGRFYQTGYRISTNLDSAVLGLISNWKSQWADYNKDYPDDPHTLKESASDDYCILEVEINTETEPRRVKWDEIKTIAEVMSK